MGNAQILSISMLGIITLKKMDSGGVSRNSFPIVYNLDHFMSEEFQVNLGKSQLGAVRERIFILSYNVLIYVGKKRRRTGVC